MIMDLPNLIMPKVAVQPKGERNAYADHQNAVVLLVRVAQDRHGTGNAFMAEKVLRSLSCFKPPIVIQI